MTLAIWIALAIGALALLLTGYALGYVDGKEQGDKWKEIRDDIESWRDGL